MTVCFCKQLLGKQSCFRCKPACADVLVEHRRDTPACGERSFAIATAVGFAKSPSAGTSGRADAATCLCYRAQVIGSALHIAGCKKRIKYLQRQHGYKTARESSAAPGPGVFAASPGEGQPRPPANGSKTPRPRPARRFTATQKALCYFATLPWPTKFKSSHFVGCFGRAGKLRVLQVPTSHEQPPETSPRRPAWPNRAAISEFFLRQTQAWSRLLQRHLEEFLQPPGPHVPLKKTVFHCAI